MHKLFIKGYLNGLNIFKKVIMIIMWYQV